jgi:phosphopentomutase
MIMDGAGVGALPDADKYGDRGSNTLGHIALAINNWHIPNLISLGLDKLISFPDSYKTSPPRGAFGKMASSSPGKDTTTGHWELSGIVLEKPFPLYPKGFPEKIISLFEAEIGRKVLGNISASGTEIIQVLGEEHLKTGYPIVYTSADSVFQIAAHEEIVPPETLYQWCTLARTKVLTGEHAVGRVIARPFSGKPGRFSRTTRRRDFSLSPPGPTLLDRLSSSGYQVLAVGKVKDVFADQGITRHIPASGNTEIIDVLRRGLQEDFRGLMWATLVDFDMLYGHRNDVSGFAAAMEEFDGFLGEALQFLTPKDLLVISADHGCDPTFPGTDHTREYIPLLLFNPTIVPASLGIRQSFADLGATVCELLGCPQTLFGKSFAETLF